MYEFDSEKFISAPEWAWQAKLKKTQKSSYIQYKDANNLYGWEMLQTIFSPEQY